MSAVIPDRPELPAIRLAVARRATIEFRYRGVERRVDPWGLLLRGGFWYVIGHDHTRGGEKRTFRVGTGSTRPTRPMAANTASPAGETGSFERLVVLSTHRVPCRPQADRVCGRRQRRRRCPRRRGARRGIGRTRRGRAGGWFVDGSILVTVPASDLAAFRSWVLGLLEHAVVEQPEQLRQHLGVLVRSDRRGRRAQRRPGRRCGAGVSGPRNAEDDFGGCW